MAETTENFDLFNFQQSKEVSVVVCIDGLPFCFGNTATYSKVKYGDPGIVYGQPGLVYGGLRKRDDVEDLLSLSASSLTISQQVEPEQGRGSISTMNLGFIDRAGIMSEIVSPGQVLPDILGRSVVVWLGYRQTSFPTDYFVIFRGFVTNVKAGPGLITLQLSDANSKKRQTIFTTQATKLTAGITNAATTIPVVATQGFHAQILGPTGGYDLAIKTYIKIEDEFIQYGPTGTTPTSFTGVTRGSRGTLAVAHAINADVLSFMEIQDNAVDMALKLMLSGWSGNWVSAQPVQSVVGTLSGLGNVPNSITFPLDVDVLVEYGLTVGDFVSMSGAGPAANNFTNRRITQILDFSTAQKRRIIVVDGAALAFENPAAGTVSFRSKYDTYPTSAGCRMRPSEVDVEGHELLKAQFLAGNDNRYRFLISDEQAGKTFIEKEIWLPIGCYSLTRNGRVSAKITKPPLADAILIELNKDNILNAPNLRPERAVNARTFFNDIYFVYDYDDDGEPRSRTRFLDTDSLNIIGLSQTLRIESKGLRSDLASDINVVVQRRADFLLSRYKNAAMIIMAETNFGTGNQIEAGDVVALNGDGLSITNFLTGTRSFGTQLFEVVDRKLNILNGQTSLKLVSGIGGDATDRFATISPSSVVSAGSTTSVVVIQDSFSSTQPRFPSNEPKKWEGAVNQLIAVHSEDFTIYEETTLIGFDPTNTYRLQVSPPLSFAPTAGMVVEIARYPNTTDPGDGLYYKQRYGHVGPTVLVVTGLSSTQFTVAVGDASKFFVDARVRVHDAGFSIDSGDVKVTAVSGVTITVEDLGFTPAVGQRIDLIGFPDQGGAYRWI